MNSFFSVDLIFFIMIAALLVFRLRNVLGRRTGNEKKPGFGFSFDAKVLDKNSNNIKEIKINKEHILNSLKKYKNLDKNGDLKRIYILSPNFSPKKFLKGAKDAFEIIVAAYAKGNLKKVKDLLSPNIFKTFSNISNQRIKKKQTLEHTLISFKSEEIKRIILKSTIAEIAVRFVTEQVNLLKNNKGQTIEGNNDYIENHIDYWIFSKDLKFSNPNWKLIVTKSEK